MTGDTVVADNRRPGYGLVGESAEAPLDLAIAGHDLLLVEVALLLLKELSHKDIAGVREVSEATVRHQATAPYRKAGLAGRHDLAAFFLEDLLGPRSPDPESVFSTVTS